MTDVSTEEIIATSNALLNNSVDSLEGSADENPRDVPGEDIQSDSLMDSYSHADDSLNDTSDSVGDTYQAVSFVSKTQKRLFPSDCQPPCTMDPEKVIRLVLINLCLMI